MTHHLPAIPPDMRRVQITGTTGSGKSTLARALAEILHTVHNEFDAHRFLPHWQTRPDDDFRDRIERITRPETWVSCGNYRVIRDIVWSRTDTLVFLDYPLRVNLWRLTRRSLARSIRRENLWDTGNRESLFRQLQWNDKSLYYWAFKTYHRRRVEMARLMSLPEYAHLRYIHLTSPRQTDRWLEAVRVQYARQA